MFDSAAIRTRKFFLAWMVVTIVAFALDAPVTRMLAPVRPDVKASDVAEEIREGGHFVMTLLAALVVAVLHEDRWRPASLVVISAGMTGVLRSLIGPLLGRPRPVLAIAPFDWHPFAGDLHTFLHAKNISFPSGHASIAFGTAVALACVLPRGRMLFIGAACLVALERVAESAHYLSDVTGAALLAVLVLPLAVRLHGRLWKRPDERTSSAGTLATS